MEIKVKITRSENATHFNKSIGDVVIVPLDDYITGVVASEVGNAHIEAAKAQAIAARTFAYPYYSKGSVITDSSSTHQAYRASRVTNGKYPNAIKASSETSGMLLYYDGKVLSTCSYSASNGGRTVSSQQRWGGYRAWLIEQEDPWDYSVTQGKKTGHGVGMSQSGAKYAASIGKTCVEILAFYYPTTSIRKESEDSMIKSNDLISKFKMALDEQWGYIWGKSGQVWTQSQQDAATKDMTVKYGSKWVGKRVADCSGMFAWAFKQLGSSIYHGSNTIWNKYCSSKGALTNGQELKPGTALFLVKDGNRHHIGLYIGNDTVIEAKGTQYGVVTSKVSHWNEWGELKDVDYTNSEAETPITIDHPTLRKGATGSYVIKMQELLISHSYDCGSNGADGLFGSMTLSSLKAYQEAAGLTADGICGSQTWGSLEKEIPSEKQGAPIEAESPVEEEPNDTDKLALLWTWYKALQNS